MRANGQENVHGSGRVVPPAPLPVEGLVAYPQHVARDYRERGWWTGQTHDAFLRDAVAAGPDRLAVVDGARRLTYGRLDDLVGRTAAYLVEELGLRRGERVIVQLPNVAEFVVVVFALFRAGAVPIFTLPAHRRSDLQHFAQIAEAVAIVTFARISGFDHAAMARESASAVPSVRAVLLLDELGLLDGDLLEGRAPAASVPVNPADLAFLQLSGGTTGTPKLIPRTHDDYLYSVRESARICGLSERSRMLVVMPIAHNFTMSSPGILGIIHAGGTIVLTQDPSPASVFGLIAEHQVTIVPAVPPLVMTWLNSPEITSARLDSLEVVQVGGAKLSRSVAERIPDAFGATLQQVFGMAEGLVNYTRLDDDAETIVATQGLRISPGDEVRVVDDHDIEVSVGEPGHLLTRGPYTIRGYFRAPEHDARSFTADGFYRTGDVVIEREDGYLTVVGRSKDQINRGGEKIAPEEVENALLRHEAVHDVSVRGVPDDVLGERIAAYVVLKQSAGKPPRAVDLRRFLAAGGLSTFKIPDVVEFVETLPATGVGKVDRARLAASTPHSRAEPEERTA